MCIRDYNKNVHRIATSRGTKKAMSKIPKCHTCKNVKLVSYESRKKGVCKKCDKS